jgi:TRAP-type transport system periplasmic protein
MQNRFAAAAAVTLTLLALPATAEETKFVMTLASVAPQDSPWSALLVKLEQTLEKKSNGRLEVKLKIGGVLGDEIESITKCRRGQIQAVGASTGAFASLVPELNVIELPYLFRNYEEADTILDDVLTPPLGELFRGAGLVLGFWSENGYRHFGTRDAPVKTAKDLQGKKMRSQESPVHIAMYKALGASPIPLPTTEVPQALATGNVDGFDQSALYMIAASWTKSIKFVTLSEHIYQPAAISYNKAWFDGLPKDLQTLVLEEGRALQGRGRKAVREIFPDLLEILKSQNITVYKPTAEERAALEKATKSVQAELEKTQGARTKKLLADTHAALAKIRGGS